MPIIYSKDSIQTDQLQSLKWFADRVSDYAYDPGATQESLEENLSTLRAVYDDNQLGGVFMEHMNRVRLAWRDDDAFKRLGLYIRVPYTYDDFIYSEAPYQEIDAARTAFERGQITAQVEQQAVKVGIKPGRFRELNNSYSRSLEKQVTDGKMLTFPIQPKKDEKISLDPGEWHIDNTGIWREKGSYNEYACFHPIAPVERLKNIDTGEEKLVIAYEHEGRIEYVTKSKLDLFDSKKIINLAMVGVAVTSRTASALSDFINEIEVRNHDKFQSHWSVSRLGFLTNGMFSPYSADVQFDGDAAFGTVFHSITEKGDYNKWLECAIKCRYDTKIAHAMLAASFASVLLCKIGALPFFVHLWGGGSGTGKTVALMLAASVWGNPEIGMYPQTFNSTQVGHERTAAFLNNLPMCIDELQLSKDSHGRSNFDVYQLAQGVGRTRGNRSGGVEMTPTWKLCILSTGESPIVQGNAGAGAINRVIDIECKPAKVQKVVSDGIGTSRVLKQNYGFAGRKFIEALTDDLIQKATDMYDEQFTALCNGETTEKQAMAAAAILVADKLSDEIVFHTGNILTADDIAEFLKTSAEVSVGQRGYNFLCDWVTMNISKFADGANERYGKIDGDYAYIIRTVYNTAMQNAGYDGKAVLSWMNSEGLISTSSDGKHLSKLARVGELVVRCVAVKVDSYSAPEDDELSDFITLS